MNKLALAVLVSFAVAPLLIAAATPDPPITLDLNALVGGGAGATLVGVIFYVGKLILDRTIPSRSDARANITILLEGLQSMVKVLQDEKAADAIRLADRQRRIDELEESSDADFRRKAELQSDVIELRAQIARRDRHIKQLIYTLVQLGGKVENVDGEQLDITLPASAVPKLSDAELKKIAEEA